MTDLIIDETITCRRDNYKQIVDVLTDGNNYVREIVINDNNKTRKIFTDGVETGKHK